MNKSVLIAIQPYWVFLIIARAMGWDIPQHKTVEARKDFPKDPAWNKVTHIYCSKNRKSFNRIPKQYQPLMEKFLGKVIGEFVCDNIETLKYNFDGYGNQWHEWNDEYVDYKDMCLSERELENYLGTSNGYGWHISQLKIYDKPKELGEFFTKGECHPEQNEYGCLGCKNLDKGGDINGYGFTTEDSCYVFGIKPLTRPPQSWCYVEEL